MRLTIGYNDTLGHSSAFDSYAIFSIAILTNQIVCLFLCSFRSFSLLVFDKLKRAVVDLYTTFCSRWYPKFSRKSSLTQVMFGELIYFSAVIG